MVSACSVPKPTFLRRTCLGTASLLPTLNDETSEMDAMGYGRRKTLYMSLVMAAGVAVALLGFSGTVVPFGVTIVLAFLIWIVGARLVHRSMDRV